MELYSYTLSVCRAKGCIEELFSPILPLPVLLELLAESFKSIKANEIIIRINIKRDCYCKVKVKDSFKKTLGKFVADEYIPISKTSIDEVTGKTLYHHFIFYEGEWREGRISSIVIEDMIMPVINEIAEVPLPQTTLWYSVKIID